MAAERLVFCIGPVPALGSDMYAVMVSPARTGADTFLADTVREGLHDAKEAYPGDRLLASPDLADDARAVGLELARFDGAQRDIVIAAAYEVAIGSQLDIKDRALIGQLARAGACLMAATPWAGADAVLYAAVSLEGAVEFKKWEVVIAGPPEGEPGITAYPGDGAILRLVETVDQGGVSASAEIPSVALSLEPAPPTIAGALRAALGSGVFPRPIALEGGEMAVVDDERMAIICALAESIAVLAEKKKPEAITVRTVGLELRAIARPFNPAD